jgi:uncharacterized protein (DUF305 family)
MKRKQLIFGGFIALVLSACGQQADSGGIFTTGSDSHTHSHAADTVLGNTPPPPDGHQHSVATIVPDTYDAWFIDSMATHHNGAIQMSEDALRQSERDEIKKLAEHIIDEQHKEIQQMAVWREQWYPGSHVEGDTGTPMGDMHISSDTSRPFDQRFIEAMIAHHQGAVDMAKEAQAKGERAEIRQLAAQIIKEQEAEIVQMKAWQQQWFAQ